MINRMWKRFILHLDPVLLVALGLLPTLINGLFPSFINLSTLQAFYSARLTRAYLGASNGARFHGEDGRRYASAAELAAGLRLGLRGEDVSLPPLEEATPTRVLGGETATRRLERTERRPVAPPAARPAPRRRQAPARPPPPRRRRAPSSSAASRTRSAILRMCS